MRGTIDRLLPPASRLGKYELISHVAVGGMAEIYVARASGIEGFEKAVILKRILPQHAADPDFVEMFLDEARLAATLHHPNVVQVFDIGVHDDSHFFTMEYIHGENLTEILRAAHRGKRGMSVENAIAIAAGVAAGLHHAHDKKGPDGQPLGIVHRDVSPANVMVTFDGGVKVVDFGIAKAAAHGSRTRDGALKGKVSYMSPEQCRGEPLDRRSDVFAIGILLHELTTGKRLFKGDTEYAILQAVINTDAPPPSSIVATYLPGLERIVMRALARDPELRYPTAQAMQIDLEELAREEKMSLSAVGLGRFMREIFLDRLESGALRHAPRFARDGSGQSEEPTRLTSVETPRRIAKPRRSRPVMAIVGAAILVCAALLARCVVRSGTRASASPPSDAVGDRETVTPDAAARVEVAVPVDAGAAAPPDAALPRPMTKKHVTAPVAVPDAGAIVIDAAPARQPEPPPDASGPPMFRGKP